MIRLRHLRHDERGASLLYITVGFMAFFAATALAIDVGMLMTARGQAQTAADAGALAGAIALAVDDFDDRSPTGPAVLSRHEYGAGECRAQRNQPSVEPEDVTFPLAPSGEAESRAGGRVPDCRAQQPAIDIHHGGVRYVHGRYFGQGNRRRRTGQRHVRASDRSRFPTDGPRTGSTVDPTDSRSIVTTTTAT